MPHQDRVDMWRGILGGAISPDWDAVFNGYSATVDWPTAHFWRELAMHYPDAKIVLSWRSPDSWYASMDSKILQIMRAETDPDAIPFKLGNAVFGGNYDNLDRHLFPQWRNHETCIETGYPYPDQSDLDLAGEKSRK